MNHSVDVHFPSRDIRIIAEPGRFYVESAYTVACQVHSKREIFHNNEFDCIMYYLNDGVFGSLSNYLYQKIETGLKLSYPITLKAENEEVFKSIIWGPTCDSFDQVI